jgi:predicted CXXCH cytochrome family protein
MLQCFTSLSSLPVATLLLALLPVGLVGAADQAASSFGEIAIPAPSKPANAENCVEPVDIMRRDHMKFLMHQRDATVLEGERDKKYSLVGCMNCHNPASADEKVIRYEDPEHFCSSCHQYTSVKIDCFECHADRGLASSQQSWLESEMELTAHSFDFRKERVHGD